MQFRRKTTPRVGIDIAPLVDVVFLLVIFFAASTTFLETSGLELELPESSSTAERESQELTVYLDAEGAVALEDETLDREELAVRLREELEQRDKKVVVLRADTLTEHGQVVEIMDLIRLAGAEGMTVATTAKPTEPGQR
ncbi:MAG: biopolymer transporter ExbD [Acidobacteriota bacterium]|nr:biopolymer transporter ExbD [Acidobacteriota bacterium]